MQVLRLYAAGELRVETSPSLSPGPDELCLQVRLCALCRTDAKLCASGHRDLILPRVPGHEIVAVDEAGTAWCLWPGQSCGVCEMCRHDRENLCAEMSILGFHRDGGLATEVLVPKSALLPIPPGLPDQIAVLGEPLACGLNALERLSAQAGEALLIFGGGPVGLLLALGARVLGLDVTVVEPRAERRQRGEGIADDAGFRLVAAPPSSLFDLAIPATNAHEALVASVQHVHPGGRVCAFSGLAGAPPDLHRMLDEIHYRELDLRGAYGCTRRQVTTALGILDQMRGTAALLLERECSLAEVPDVLQDMLDSPSLRCIVRPNA